MLHIVNDLITDIRDGGDTREFALNEFVVSHGGDYLLVKDSFFFQNKWNRFAQLLRLIKRILRLKHKVILLSYPRYPFFWEIKFTKYYFISLLFCIFLYLTTRIVRKKVILDVPDLLTYEPMPNNFGIKSRLALVIFESTIFTLCDEIWIASIHLRKILQEQNRSFGKKAKVVINGSYPIISGPRDEKESRIFRFIYAGSMQSSRNLNALLSSFIQLPDQEIELHLCGVSGEWVPGYVNDKRIIYHGVLQGEELNRLLISCDAGINPYPECGYFQWVFPAKLGHYIMADLPVVATNTPEVKLWISKLNIGYCYPLSDISEGLIKMKRDTEHYQLMLRNIKKYQPMFNWNHIFENALKSDSNDLFNIDV